MNKAILERMELIASDTRKEFSYRKDTGKWSWCNRGEEQLHGEFTTRYDALADAVEPYINEE